MYVCYEILSLFKFNFLYNSVFGFGNVVVGEEDVNYVIEEVFINDDYFVM